MVVVTEFIDVGKACVTKLTSAAVAVEVVLIAIDVLLAVGVAIVAAGVIVLADIASAVVFWRVEVEN